MQAVQDAIEDRSLSVAARGVLYVRIPHCVSRDASAGRSDLAVCRRQWRVGRWRSSPANIVGSLIAGWCTQRFRSKYILAMMYGSRALLIGWYLLEPRTKWTFYSFAVGLGLTWLATVPPTATIVGKLSVSGTCLRCSASHCSHTRSVAFLALISAVSRWFDSVDYQWMWYADMALAAAAAVINLPIREARIAPVSSPALL